MAAEATAGIVAETVEVKEVVVKAAAKVATRVAASNRTEVEVTEVRAEAQDIVQTHQNPCVTAIIAMARKLGGVSNPSRARGRTRSLHNENLTSLEERRKIIIKSTQSTIRNCFPS